MPISSVEITTLTLAPVLDLLFTIFEVHMQVSSPVALQDGGKPGLTQLLSGWNEVTSFILGGTVMTGKGKRRLSCLKPLWCLELIKMSHLIGKGSKQFWLSHRLNWNEDCGVWRAGSVVKSMYHSHRGSEFGSQHLSLDAHSHQEARLRRLQHLRRCCGHLSFCGHLSSHGHTPPQTHNFKQEK